MPHNVDSILRESIKGLGDEFKPGALAYLSLTSKNVSVFYQLMSLPTDIGGRHALRQLGLLRHLLVESVS